MTTTVNYDLDELQAAFEQWVETIESILKKPLPKLEYSLDAIHVTGYTYDEFVRALREGIPEHLVSKSDHKLLLTDLFLNSKVALSGISDETVRVGSGRIEVDEFIYSTHGLRGVAEATSLTLLSQTIQYLILKITITTNSSVPEVKNTLYLSDVGVESYLERTIATINKPNNTVYVNPLWIGEPYV